MATNETTKKEQATLHQHAQVVSRDRVVNHGEVYTNAREVNAMLDLVKNETERVDSRFLEPACGHGNFLVEVLSRKLQVIENRYKKNKIEFERYSVIAIGSIYGIDLLEDNVITCRERLFDKFEEFYKKIFYASHNLDCLLTIKFILNKNIVWGDALTFKTVDEKPKSIIFSEWSEVSPGMIKRRDFSFEGLLIHSEIETLPLFSDMGEGVFIPTPVKDYPLKNYLGLMNE